MESLWSYFAPRVRTLLQAAARRLPGALEEVRLRAGGPLHLVWSGGDGFVAGDGSLAAGAAAAPALEPEEVARTFQLACQGSVYAWEEELRGGFLTLPGGHRVGIAGRAAVQEGRLVALRPVAGLNVRIARELPGVAAPLLPYLTAEPGGGLHSTLILSPPQAGKTTLLRDLIRLAAGPGRQKVAVVDERSELAGCAGGVPRLDLGPRTDVLDGCPKAVGMLLAIRALSPHLVAVDEVGGPEDAAAVRDALGAGVAVLATAHAGALAQAGERPALAGLVAAGAFRRAVVLSRRLGPATVEQVWDLAGCHRPLLERPLPLAAAGGHHPATAAAGGPAGGERGCW